MTTRTTVTIPEGPDLNDLNDRIVRQKVELSIKKKLGSTFEVLWPRPKDKTRDVVAVDSRPGLKKVSLGSDVKQSSGPAVFAKLRTMGLQMVEFDPYGGFALACTMDDQTVAIRNRLAEALKTDPWNLEVICNSVYDPDPDLKRERLDQVCITRMPSQSITADRRAATWRELIPMLKDGTNGWLVDEDSVSKQVQLSYGPARKLPGLVPLADLMPAQMDPNEWARIPLGIDEEGRQVCTSLAANPHSVYVGPTGTGKTALLLTHAVGALARGHQLILVDVAKHGLDFSVLKPWCRELATELDTAQAVLEAVRKEMERRVEFLNKNPYTKISEVPYDLQVKHRLQPMTVIIDEYATTVMEESVPKSLPKDSDFRKDAEARNANHALIAFTVGQLARLSRAASISLVVALQRPDAAITGGEMRFNLTNAIQLAPPGKPIGREALTMVFPGETGAQAALALSELDDGHSLGLAVMAAEGGSARGFRVAYAEPNEIPALLEAVPVPHAEPFTKTETTTEDPDQKDKENF